MAWVRRKDSQQKFYTVPYQQCPAPPMTSQLYEACPQAIHVVTAAGRIINAGRASLFVLEEIGYPRWLVRPFTWPPLVWLTELGYRILANNRPFFSKFLFTGQE